MENDRVKKVLQGAGIFSGGPKVVTIGGGTGLSVILRGLKKYTSNITAIVTVADDGGSSGMLRQDYGVLPPGDIRNCIMSLANTEPTMEKLMHYRFTDGSLKGQSFGNLLITALNDICGGFDLAVKEISNVLAVTGRVMPVTLEDITLFAELEDGTIIKGESQIPIMQQKSKSKIKRIFLKPSNCKALPEAMKAIEEADAIILGPGSLYTSVIPNLLVKGISKSIAKSTALKIYVSNIMTQKGESIGYSLSDHIKTINEHANNKVVEYVIANNQSIPGELVNRYRTEEAAPVALDLIELRKLKVKVITGNFVNIEQGFIRHDYNSLTETIFGLICDEKLAGDARRLLDYYFIYDKLKK